MMFNCFRVILVFFLVACLVLSCFALTGSWKNEEYLTGTFLINFHLNRLDLRQIINSSIGGNNKFKREDNFFKFNKREDTVPTGTTTTDSPIPSNAQNWINAATSLINDPNLVSQFDSVTSSLGVSVPTSVPTDNINGYYTTISAAIADLLNNVTPQELGIADVYSTSYWGYCRGFFQNNGTSPTQVFDNSLGRFIDENFDNSNVNYTWCSPPTPGFFFDPFEIIKSELNNTLQGISLDSQSTVINQLSQQYLSEIEILINNLTPEDLNLPGNLQNDLKLLNNITKASFALLLVTICLSFIAIVIQFMGCCCSPNNCCLSVLNFIFQLLIFIIAIISAGLVTGAFIFVRRKVNDEIGDFGIKSFLSINFYAFIWSASMAALLVVIFSLLGHCCGMFGSGRRKYRQVSAYEHKEPM
ncbi:uncharacterized protein KGF55_005493 [Candida pseudojiufengensis]|uniref:uncharacterized protein n=1 Tax=Candida pseudojiufengensis TaxID=497109 RepID=UPI002224C758|nr:uncharacterized protein KGF55_005493 [Candida pseudojiufengensis]KAI5959150.1 hypothetical protein KGF55_005493 [Candida pseudojiufengensis]